MKRQRLSQETTSALTLSAPSRTYVSGFETKDVNGNDKKHFKSTTTHSGSRKFGLHDIVNLICPTWKVKREGYGTFLKGFDYNGTASSQSGKSIVWTSGLQQWSQFVHMPRTNKAIPAITTYSLEELVAKAVDVNNLTLTTANTAISSSTGPFTSLNGGSYEQQFCYNGGYCQHIFTNTCDHNIEMEFFISTPRRFLTADGTYDGTFNTAGPATYSLNPTTLALLDYQQNIPLRSSVAPIVQDTKIDQATDLMFTYNPSCRSLHYHWKVHAPKKCSLLPGQQVIYTVKLPSFKFTNSDWNHTQFSGANRTAIPEYLPFCTVILDVRCRGEICHDAAYTNVTYGAGHLTHVQKEYHSCKALPYTSSNNVVHINNMDTDGSTNLVINPLTEQEQDMID